MVTDIWVASRLLKKTHMPPACRKQAFRIVALDRCGNHSRSKRSRSNVPPKYASARRIFARRSAELGRSLASEIFFTSLQTDFFNNPLVRNHTSGELSTLREPQGPTSSPHFEVPRGRSRGRELVEPVHGTDSSEGPSDACPVRSHLDRGVMNLAHSASYGTSWR